MVTDCVTRFVLSKRFETGDKLNLYKDCVWSDPNCKTLPDIFGCNSLSVERYYIVHLLTRLKVEDSTTNAGADNSTATVDFTKLYGNGYGKCKHGLFLPASIRCKVCGQSNFGKTNLLFTLLFEVNGLCFSKISTCFPIFISTRI